MYSEDQSIQTETKKKDRKSEISALCDRVKVVTIAAMWKKGSLALYLINFWVSSTWLWRESPVAGR